MKVQVAYADAHCEAIAELELGVGAVVTVGTGHAPRDMRIIETCRPWGCAMYRLHGFMLAALFVMGAALTPPPRCQGTIP